MYIIYINIYINILNDPAAGSPTAALLRLLLPPDKQVRKTLLK